MNGPGQPSRFVERLGAAASRLGAVAMGVVAARPFVDLRAQLEACLEAGRYPRFCETDPVRRTEPERWLPGCRSLWVAAFAYPAPGAAAPARGPGSGPWGRIAAYALPDDYHRELHRRLRWLVRWAARAAGLPRSAFRIFVDTGPPVERDLWRRSGAGWIGKNTCAYAPGAGSWIVLGVVASRLDLPEGPLPLPAPDGLPPLPPVPADPCAGCDRCITACPTGALAPYRMDPARCIAQRSQQRGALPEEQRAGLGRWLFGCDLCQLACPYNAPDRAPLAFRPDGALRPAAGAAPWIPLRSVLEMEGPAFRAGLGRGAASWRGLALLQRNAAYIAGVILRRRAAAPQGPEAAAARATAAAPTGTSEPPAPRWDSLRQTLRRLAASHPSPVVREACAWALQSPPPPGDRPRPSPCRTRPSAATSPPGCAIPGR
ncbi:MAG TPA: QueG-associated DUF1730 domain-containing protein [Limnochordales bacterium]